MKEKNTNNGFSNEEPENAPGTASFLYYQYLSDCTPLSADDEVALWKKIEKALQKIRKRLYTFGFVLREHIQLLGRLDPGALEDTFHFPENGNIQELASEWKNEIVPVYEERERGIPTGSGHVCLEQESVELLNRYPVHVAKLREWFHTAEVCLNEPEPEERFFLSVNKARASIKMMKKDFADMDLIYQQIVIANLRLVVNLAKQFHRDGLQLQDLIQEGNYGLLQALDRFDHTRGHRFATYATWWVKQGVLRSVASQTRIIRLPSQMLNAIAKIRRAERQHIQKYAREPEITDLALALNMSAEKIRAIQKMTAQPISLLASVGDEQNNLTLEQILPQDEENNSPARGISAAMVTERLKKALNVALSERERQILILHFGLGDVRPRSTQEISRMFHLTTTRIRQIEAAALGKLRNPELTGTIDEYYD